VSSVPSRSNTQLTAVPSTQNTSAAISSIPSSSN
jgi:hypothetical protein